MLPRGTNVMHGQVAPRGSTPTDTGKGVLYRHISLFCRPRLVGREMEKYM